MIILPYPIDYLPQYLGGVFAKLTSWSPVGTRVSIGLVPPPDSLVGGQKLGTIIRVFKGGKSGTSSSLIRDPIITISLDTPFRLDGRDVKELVASSRYAGHALPRLLVCSCIMNFYALDPGSDPLNLEYSSQIGIGALRRVSRRKPAEQ